MRSANSRGATSLSPTLSLCASIVWMLNGSQVQAQPLPQPALHTPLHLTCQQDVNSRGLWFDQLGDVDIFGPVGGTWFYSYINPLNLSEPLSLFMDQSSGCPAPPAQPTQFPNTNQVPLLGCLDYDANYGILWGGTYNKSGHFWYHFYFNFYPPPPPGTGVWIDAFDAAPLFSDVFVHDPEPEQWDGLAVMPDSTLYIKPDEGFNLFHVDPNLPDPPQLLADSFLLPFPASGVEVYRDFLFVVAVEENRIYVYSRPGKYPLGFFRVMDASNPPQVRDLEDLDLRTEGSNIYLTGIELGSQTNDVELLEWDVQPLILDTDNDGLPNLIDNCPLAANPNQLDSNGNGIGNACSSMLDYDNDGWADHLDNCPYNANGRQSDADRDGVGDVCDNVTQCFGAEQLNALDNRVIDVAIGDLDNDGDGDVVTLHDRSFKAIGDDLKVGTVAIRWSGSHGSIGEFSEQSAYAVASRGLCRDLVLADINMDGYIDIAVVHDHATDPDITPPTNGPLPEIFPGISVLWNDGTNHFGDMTHIQLRFADNDPVLRTGHPVGLYAIDVDGTHDASPELVVVGHHQFSPGNVQGTITVVRYNPQNSTLDDEDPIGLSGGVPIRAIAMPPQVGSPEQDIAILKSDDTVAIHRRTLDVFPYFDTTGYSASIVGNAGQTTGRDLAYGFFRNTNAFDLAVIPDEGTGGTALINFFINNPAAQTLTLGNGGVPQQLSTLSDGRLWRVVRYPSSPYDGILVLNQVDSQFPPDNAIQGVQVSRFNSTGLAAGTFNLASREDLLDNSRYPMRAVMALGDISRSCGRDLVVADYFEPPQIDPPQAMPKLALARCPFDANSRSFERPVPSRPTCAVIADVDGVNGADLIVGTALDEFLFNVGSVKVFRQTPGIPNRFAYDPSEAPYFPQVGGFDVNAQILAMKSGDFGPGSLPDVVIGFESGGEQYLQVLRRTSTSAFEIKPERSVTNTGFITALTTGDFDNDGRTDVVALTDGPAPNLFLSRGLLPEGTLGAVAAIDDQTTFAGAAVVPVLNINNNRLDLCSLLLSPAVRILHNDGNGAFGSPTDLVVPTPSAGTAPIPVAVTTGRITGIVAPYIACADSANNQVVVFVDFGSGYQVTSSIVVSSIPGIQPTSIFALDLEADGDDDLVLGFNEANTVSVLTCLGRGHFAPMTLPAGRAPRFVTGGDVDGNGLSDILEVGGFDADDSHLRVIFSNCGGM